MFDEKQLENLQSIKVSDDKKQTDFEKMEQRLNKKPFYWQVPAVAFSMVLLLLFLVATMPTPRNTVNLSSDATISEILFHDGESDPKSVYYLMVERTVDREQIEHVQEVMKSFRQISKPSKIQKANKTYRISYNDGSYRVLNEYNSGQKTYFKDAETGNYYEIAEGKGYIYLVSTKSSIWQYVLLGVVFVLLFGCNAYIGKKMRVEGDPKRKLPMHSHTSQSLVTILYILVTFSFFVIPVLSNVLLHIGWIYGFSIVMIVVNIYIEKKHDNNGWRKLNFINSMLMAPTYLFLFLQLQ